MTAAAPLAILHDDDRIVAINKPPGVPVVPAGGEPPDACVRRMLEAQVRQALWVVHRLDRDTSGVLVFARSADAHRRLNAWFEQRLVSKRYVALTAGIPVPDRGAIEVPLHAARRGRTRPAAPGEHGQHAATDYAVVRAWTRGGLAAALVEAHPRTGRHHQIRVHLRSAGTPILFDEIYGRSTLAGEWAEGPCRRLALHAVRLDLPADAGRPPLCIEAPIWDDVAAQIGWFDARWATGPTRAAAGE
jgi:RluA family pseudouridine synthase